MPRRWPLIALLAFLLTPAGAAQKTISGSLKVQASGPLVAVTRQWADAFMKKYPGTAVQVTEVSTGAAVAALRAGQADIAEIPEPAADSDNIKSIPVAVEAIGVYVNQDSPVVEITYDQLRAIFTGQVTDWSATGSTLGPITVYGLEASSGTYARFRETVLQGKDFGNNVISLSRTDDVVQAVKQDTRAIGYGDTVMVKGVKVLPVGKGGVTDTYYADERNVALENYPLSRKIYFETAGDPKGLVKMFEEWVLSSSGEKISLHGGFFAYVRPRGPVTDDTLDQETMGHPSQLW